MLPLSRSSPRSRRPWLNRRSCPCHSLVLSACSLPSECSATKIVRKVSSTISWPSYARSPSPYGSRDAATWASSLDPRPRTLASAPVYSSHSLCNLFTHRLHSPPRRRPPTSKPRRPSRSRLSTGKDCKSSWRSRGNPGPLSSLSKASIRERPSGLTWTRSPLHYSSPSPPSSRLSCRRSGTGE